jgi:EmrB/QacA subfamily drug resistance transporter
MDSDPKTVLTPGRKRTVRDAVREAVCLHGRRLILASLLLAALVINLDTTIVNVALPSLVRELHATTSQLQWIVDAYNLVFAAFVLAAGSLSDRVGRKGMLLAGLAVFGLASVAGGLGSSPGDLIAARCFMGLGAAVIFPATLSLIANVFTRRGERALAIGLWGATAGAGVALGPITGGWLLEHYSWSSIFFALAPVAGVTAALVAVTVPTSRDPGARRADLPGLALSTAGIGLLVFTVIQAPAYGWGSVRTVAGFAAAAAVLAAFIVWERRVPAPMIDVGLFRNPRFTAASGSVTVAFFALSGFIFLVTQYFQFLKGYGPLSTGVRLLPVAICVGVSSVLGTRLALRLGTKMVVAAGLVSLAAGLAWASSVSVGTSYLWITAQMVLLGCGIGLTSAPATEAIMGVVPKEKAGVGSAVNDATRVLGATLGVAVIGSVYASLYASRLTSSLPARLPRLLASAAHDSVGAALGIAGRVDGAGQAGLAVGVRAAASGAFLHGYQAGCLTAAGVAAAGAAMAGLLLPAQPQVTTGRERPAPAISEAEPVLASMLICLARCQSAGATLLEHQAAGNGARAARHFYQDAFGWQTEPVVTDYHLAASGGYRAIRGGAAAAALFRRAPGVAADPFDGRARDAVLYVEVPDVEQALHRVEALGGRGVLGPRRVPGSPEYALFTDPQGVLVGLFNAADHP